MEIFYSDFFDKKLTFINKIYWVWLAFCFFYWLLYLTLACESKSILLGSVCGLIFKFVEPLFKTGYINIFVFLSTLSMPIIFLIITIARRKVPAWDFIVITSIWGLALYNMSFWPHS